MRTVQDDVIEFHLTSDGTIDADRWRILKHAHDAIRALRCNLDQWERLEDSR
jgi:hypothetical protein